MFRVDIFHFLLIYNFRYNFLLEGNLNEISSLLEVSPLYKRVK